MSRPAGIWTRWLRRRLAPHGSVDALTDRRIAGWAFGRGRVEVEAWLGDRCVARVRPAISRPDVASAYPAAARALSSGFAIEIPEGALEPDALESLRIVARPAARWLPAAELAALPVAGRRLEALLGDPPPSNLAGPFPKSVIDAVAAAWPADCQELGTVSGQRRFAARLLTIMSTPGLNSLPAFAGYARYLAACLAHCRFVERHFPAVNTNAQAQGSDFHGKPNSVRELFPIIHQLYVLKSWDIPGDFAEFGCFKGYSSAMLSFACALLGLKMHIFDSFEGLPDAPGSGYEAGQFAGGIEEVRANIARFGVLDGVEFHQGFFADTLREWRPPPLLALWMDVDLEVSARDLVPAIDSLDPRSTLFSHECTAAIFQDGEIVTAPSPDNPVPPVLRHYESMGRPLTGRYLAGYTGAFWPRDTGIAVADSDVVMDLAVRLTGR